MSDVATPDYEHPVAPLTTEQTQAVIELLIDTHYGQWQVAYAEGDRAFFHSRLSEVLDA